MPSMTATWARLLAPALGAAILTLSGCAAQRTEGADDSEEAGSNEEGVSGALPVGSKLTATANVNLRSEPSTAAKILDVVMNGSTVILQTSEPSNGFYQISYNGTIGWSSGKYLAADASSPTPLEGGQVWKFRAKTLPVDIAVFVPEAAAQAAEVDVLFYVHGLNVCSPVATKPPLSFVTDAPFRLGKLVADTKRPIVLVVPNMDWEHQIANGMAFAGKQHKLGIPANLNGVVAEVLAQVGQNSASGAPALSSLVLAGHSRAYDFLNPLAAANADPQMSKGALAQLSQVWGLDTGYVCSPISTWPAWLASKPSLEITMDYRAGTGTAACGQQFAKLVPASDGRLSVHVVPEEHCSVPGKELPLLINALP